MNNGTVIIDCFPERAALFKDRYAIVAVDVIRFTTAAATALSLGRRVFPVRSTDEAFIRAATLKDPILAGELGGNIPYGFHINNSPVRIAALDETHRPIVLVSTSGSQLLLNSEGSVAVYAACFRNFSAVARFVSNRHERVAVLGAGTRGRFRREDQMGCAWVAQRLLEYGFRAENVETGGYIDRWRGVSPEEIRGGKSAEYLRSTGQEEDLDFIVGHIDDIDTVPQLVDGELIKAR
ncbi:MAG TPA: 2-phosphosulfolactate phosphatase [Thermodesulfobacteriota bacterium]|nr:2-phosphosulfolactate phosphatase [Thermodesulfobacteriota bacterium]